MKRILLETSFSKIYMIVMIIITLLILGGYFSYAMFTVSKEKSNAISIVTGNLTYKLEVDGEEGNTLTVDANSSKEFIVTLSNPNNRTARFNFYYLGDLLDGVDTGYIEENGYNITPVETGINLEQDGTSGSSNTYIIRVSNITDSEVTITLGVEVGLDYNDLSLPENGHLFRKIINRGTVSEVIEDDIMNRLNYEDSEQTFVTGEEPYNYLWYSGKLWRVVSIDSSDNYTKLITQWNISTVTYNASGNTNFEESYMEEWLNDTTVDGFLGNLRDYENFIVTDAKWNTTMDDSNLGNITRPSDSGTVITDTVGLLNMYEYQESFGGTNYINGYLNNGLYWWTITPYNSDIVLVVDSGGNKYIDSFSGYSYGVRPSINLKSEIKIVDGRGTEEDPYRLEGDNDKDLSGVKLNTRYSGEYISFGTGENNLYRIVSHETEELTKITNAYPLKENGTFKFSAFDISSNLNYSTLTTIGEFLNTDYLKKDYFTNTQINMIEENTTWYLGTVKSGDSYRFAKYTDVNMSGYATSTDATVGLLRFGELIAGQFDCYENNVNYWLLNGVSSRYIRNVNSVGNVNSYLSPSQSNGIKPSLNLKQNVIITGGDGTLQNPFTLALE